MQAILSVLLNRPEIQIGPDLTSLKEFTADFSPEMRGAPCCQMHAFEMRSHHHASEWNTTVDVFQICP